MSSSKHYVVLVSNDLYTDQRVHKVCSFLLEQGHRPLLLGRQLKNSGSLHDREYPCRRFKLLFNKGPLFYANLNLRLFFFLLFHRCDGILSNDLDTLMAGYMASILKRNCRLIYDTHEFFTGVPELQARPRVQKVWERIEQFIFPKLEHVYTVNQDIANRYQSLYTKDLLVVRNMAPRIQQIEPIPRVTLGIPDDAIIGIMQGAGINVDRGAEEAVEAFAQIPNAYLLIVGHGDVVASLQNQVDQLAWGESIRFFPRMPYHEMMRYTATADIGLSLDKTNNLNYQLSLPNKVFDYLQAETPLLASPVKQIVELIERVPFGVIVEEVTVDEIIKQIQEIQKEPFHLQKWKNTCREFKDELCWEGEVQKIAPFFK